MRSMALIEHLLQQRGSNVLVAVVPLLAGSVANGMAPLPKSVAEASDRKHARGKHSTQPAQGDRQRDDMDLGRVHALGTAARVLRLTRSAQVHRPIPVLLPHKSLCHLLVSTNGTLLCA